MNRLEFLKKTIFINLELIETFNIFYKDTHKFELSLCNYDSKDDLDNFVKTKLKKYLNSNELIYTKIENKEEFHVAHAKNIAHKRSNGEILINLDADNILTLNFMKYIIELFKVHKNCITMGSYTFEKRGCFGRIALTKENYIKLGGYNEELKGYGGEDYGLILRAEKFLNSEVVHLDTEMLDVIEHDDVLRLTFDKDIILTDNICDNFHLMRAKCEKNDEIEKFYLDNNIINPNEFNNINIGSY